MEGDSFEESDYIFDDYEHLNPELLYSVTRTPGKGFPESEFELMQSGCDCSDGRCTEENNCSCLRYGTNYRRSSEGAVLVKEKLGDVPVLECNWRCSCAGVLRSAGRGGVLGLRGGEGVCPNRNVQFGPIGGLEVFSAGAKGLGLRTRRRIASGAFICEYAGEVISLEEAKERQRGNAGMNYIFVLREFAGDKLSGVTCVDPTYVGNIGRYINHSCQPNAAIVPVRVNDAVPWLCVFAISDIPENEEICYDYSGHCQPSGGGNVGSKLCFCGSPSCRKFLPFEDI